MFKVVSNSRMVSFQINRSLNAKKKGFNKAINKTLKSIHRDAKVNASNVQNKEAKELSGAIEINLKDKFVGVNNDKAHYAPFIEFGSKAGFREAPPETRLRPIAARYKGTPVRWTELVERVKAGGAKEPAKYARELTLEGTTPEPFFYNAVFQNKVKFKQELRRALRKRV